MRREHYHCQIFREWPPIRTETQEGGALWTTGRHFSPQLSRQSQSPHLQCPESAAPRRAERAPADVGTMSSKAGPTSRVCSIRVRAEAHSRRQTTRSTTPRREAPKPVNNLHAKISAARAEAIKFELERERAHKSPISCWSNFGTLSTVAVAQSAPAAVEQKSITIVNSNVTINQ